MAQVKVNIENVEQVNKAVNSAVISNALASIVAEEVATMTCVSMAMNSAFD